MQEDNKCSSAELEGGLGLTDGERYRQAKRLVENKSDAPTSSDPIENTSIPKAEIFFRGTPSQFIELIVESIKVAESLVGEKGAKGLECTTRASKNSLDFGADYNATLRSPRRSHGNQKVHQQVDPMDASTPFRPLQGTSHLQQLVDPLNLKVFGSL